MFIYLEEKGLDQLDKIKIATWNVNSVNQRIEQLKKILVNEEIDVIMLQEIKCENDNFPREELENLGYNVILRGQKAYNGVATISRHPIEEISNSLMGDDEARYIEGIIKYKNQVIRLINVYVPHGQSPDSPRFQYKMHFYENLAKRIQNYLKNDEILIVAGDFNVAPEDIDVYDPDRLDGSIGFHIMERKHIREILNLGLFDAFRVKYPETQEFSWWDYRTMGFLYNRGMRLDNILISAEGADIMKDCNILRDVRGWEKPSDHVPVVCVL